MARTRLRIYDAEVITLYNTDNTASTTISRTTTGLDIDTGTLYAPNIDLKTGTITNGTWTGSAVGATYGGTAQTTWATGDLLYASGTNTLAKRTIGSAGQVFVVSGGVPVWSNTIAGDITITGNLVVNGNTTTLNSTTYTIDDKNIEIGSVSTTTFTANLTAGSAVLSSMSTTVGLIPGMVVTITSGGGTVTMPAGNQILTVDSLTQVTMVSALTGTGTATGANMSAAGPSDTSANGGGITLKGTSDKTITWDSANSNWTSSEHWNLPTAKDYKINNVSVITNASGTTYTVVSSATVLTLGGPTLLLTFGAGTGNQSFITPSTGTVNFLNTNATTINAFGAASTIAIGGATLSLTFGTGTGNQSFITPSTGTVALFNTNATTINAFGAASTIAIGGATLSLTFGTGTGDQSYITNSTGTLTIFNTNATTITAFGAATTFTFGGTPTTALTATLFGNSTATATTKTINIGTAGAAGSTTNVNIGSAVASAILGTLSLNFPTILTANNNTTVALWNTNSTTINFAGAATALAIGATSGTATINNPTVVGSQTTVNLWNSTSTTVNFAGAASTFAMGANSGTLTIGNPTIVGTQTTQALWNTVATTVSAFGAATTVNIATGAVSATTFNLGTTTVDNIFEFRGNATTGTVTLRTNAGVTTALNVFNTVNTNVSAFGAATSITIGAATGTTTINNATITLANATTVNVNGANPSFVASSTGTLTFFNTNLTTLNAWQAVTTATIGATTGTFTIRNANVSLTGDLAVNGGDITSSTNLNITPTGSLTLNPTVNVTIAPSGGSVFFQPSGKMVNPVVNYDTNLGQIDKKYLTLHAAELWVETLVAQNTQATIGGRVLVGPTNILTADFASGATSMSLKYNNVRNGDIVMLEANGQVEFISIGADPTGTGPYTYSTITRNLDGTGANNWYAGDAVFNTGQVGNGFIDLYSNRSAKSRALPYLYNFNNTGSAYSANYGGVTLVSLFADGANTEVNDAVYFGDTATFLSMYMKVTTAAVYTATILWEYWNGSAWTSFSPTVLRNGSSDANWWKTTGEWSFTWSSLSGWATTAVNSVTAYWIRARISAFTSFATVPVVSSRPITLGYNQFGPTIVGNVRNSSTFNDWTEHWAIGNLNGQYGYGVDTYGAAFGKYADSQSFISVDATNGIRMQKRASSTNTTVAQWTTAGVIHLGDQSIEHLTLDSTSIKFYNNTTVMAELNAAVWTLGVTTGNYVQIDTNGFEIKNNTTSYALYAATTRIGQNANSNTRIEIDSTNGIQIITKSAGGADTTRIKLAIDGSGYLANTSIAWDTSGNLNIGANAYIGGTTGWQIAANTIQSVTTGIKLFADASSRYIALGSTLPTAVTTGGSGVWISGTSNGEFRAGAISASVLTAGISWDGTTFKVRANSTDVITALAGSATIAGWTLTSTAISNTNITISSSTVSAVSGDVVLSGGDAKVYVGAGITLDGATNGTIKVSTTFLLDGGSTGTLTLGTSASAITETANTGIFMSGGGKFRVGTATAGTNYFWFDGTNISFKTPNAELTTAGNLWAQAGGFGGTSSSPYVTATAYGLLVGAAGSVAGDGWRTPGAGTNVTVANGNFEGVFSGTWASWTTNGNNYTSTTAISPHGGSAAFRLNVNSAVYTNIEGYMSQAISSISPYSTYILKLYARQSVDLNFGFYAYLLQDAGTVASGSVTNVGHFYYNSHATNTITYNSITYNAGEVFRAVSGVTTFTGTGTVSYLANTSAALGTDSLRPITLRSSTINVGTTNWELKSGTFTTGSATGNLRIVIQWIGNPGGTTFTWDLDDITLAKEDFFAELNNNGLYVYNSASNYIKIGKGAAEFNLDRVTFNGVSVNGALNAFGTIDFWGTPVYHNGYTTIGSTTIASAINVLNSLTGISTTSGTSWYGIEVDNTNGSVISGNNPMLVYYGNTNRWMVGVRTGTDTGTQSSNVTITDNILTTTSTDTGITNKTFSTGSVWNGTTVITTYGGTGLASYTAGDMLYYASGTVLSKLAIGAQYTILQSNGSAPTWVSSAPTRGEYTAPGGGIAQEAAVTVDTYVVGSKKLLVFVDGILMRQDTGTQGVTKDRDYWEASATTIKFNFDIAAGGIIQWIILV